MIIEVPTCVLRIVEKYKWKTPKTLIGGEKVPQQRILILWEIHNGLILF